MFVGASHTGEAWGLAVSGNRVVGSNGEFVRVWNLDTGECLRREAFGCSALCVLITESRMLVSGGELLEGNIGVWEAPTVQ